MAISEWTQDEDSEAGTVIFYEGDNSIKLHLQSFEEYDALDKFIKYSVERQAKTYVIQHARAYLKRAVEDALGREPGSDDSI